MNIPIIILLILIFIVLVIISFTKHLIKLGFKLILVLIFFGVILSIVAFVDKREIEDYFPESTILYLFEQEGEIVAGYRAKGFGDEIELLGSDELEAARELAAESRFEDILDYEYRLVLLHGAEFQGEDSDELSNLMKDGNMNAIFRAVARDKIDIYPSSPYISAIDRFPAFVNI